MGKRYDTKWDSQTRTLTKTFKDPDETSISVSFDDLPANSQEYLQEYGLRQVLNDCHAGAQTMDEVIRLSKEKAEALQSGNLQRQSRGGIGVDLDKLTQALANVKYSGDIEKAQDALANFVPDLENDDEDTVKKKKQHLRAIRNFGAIRQELDRIEGKSLDDMLAA